MAKGKTGGLGRGLNALIQTDSQFDLNDTSVVKNIDIHLIHPNSDQPRKKFDDALLNELAESIKSSGVIIPIIVTKIDDQNYKIVAGERRWRASRKAGLEKIPCIIRELSEFEILQQALIENIQRQDLNPLEESHALKRLIDDYGIKHDALSSMVGKSRPAITNMLRLLNLSEKVKDMLIHEDITSGHARALLPIENPTEQVEMAEKVIQAQLSVRETEKLVKHYLEGKQKKQTNENAVDQAYQLSVKCVQDRLMNALGTKVLIKDRKNKGAITIYYHSLDELDRILEQIEK